MLSLPRLPGLPEHLCGNGLHAASLLAALLCSALLQHLQAAEAGLPYRPFLGDIQSMLEALPEEEAAEPLTSNAPTASEGEAGGTPDSLLSRTASEAPDSPSDKRPRGKSWFRGSRPSAASLLSPRVGRPVCCVLRTGAACAEACGGVQQGCASDSLCPAACLVPWLCREAGGIVLSLPGARAMLAACPRSGMG